MGEGTSGVLSPILHFRSAFCSKLRVAQTTHGYGIVRDESFVNVFKILVELTGAKTEEAPRIRFA